MNVSKPGQGKQVKSSLFETSVFLVGQHMAQYAVTGTPAAPMPARISAWAIYDVFESADGEKIFVGVVSDAQWLTFCKEFGFDELLADEGLRENNERVAARDRIMPVVTERFLQLSKAVLMDRLESSGLPFAPITKPEDLFDDPHLNASGGLLDTTLPDGQDVRLPAMPVEFDGERPAVRLNPPKSGEHTVSILRDAGYDDASIDALIADGVVSTGT